MKREDKILRLKRPRRLKPSMPPREVEAQYKRDLTALSKEVDKDIKELILPIFYQNSVDDALVNDAFDASEMLSVFTSRMQYIREKYDAIRDKYKQLAVKFGTSIGSVTKQRFYNMLRRTIGAQVDILEIATEKGVPEMLDMETSKNVSLIKSIPEKHLGKVEDIVRKNLMEGSSHPEGVVGEILPLLREEIKEEGAKAVKRAKLIARDQVGKITSALTKARHINMGVEEYEWFDSRDKRVRGNPNGLYPNVPKSRNHWKRHGKIFRYDDPPPDGHPGEAVLCRCVAIPIIKNLKLA